MANLLMVILEDVEKLPKLLAAWKRIGVPGVTLLHSVGGYRAESWLNRVGLGGLSRLFEGEIQQRTLLSVIDDDVLLERAIAEADEAVDGFDRPHSGILFVVPVARTLGLKKWTQTREHPSPTPPPMSPETLKHKTVADIMDVLKLAPAVVRVDDSLEQVIRTMLAHADVQVVAVVNEVDRLVGLIDVFTLADTFLLTFFPEEFLSHMTSLEQVEAFAQHTHIKQAADIMLEPAWVQLDDSVAKAFHIMHERRLVGLPVVDEGYHVIGYINLLELMSVCMRTRKEEQGRE